MIRWNNSYCRLCLKKYLLSQLLLEHYNVCYVFAVELSWMLLQASGVVHHSTKKITPNTHIKILSSFQDENVWCQTDFYYYLRIWFYEVLLQYTFSLMLDILLWCMMFSYFMFFLCFFLGKSLWLIVYRRRLIGRYLSLLSHSMCLS